MRGKVRIVLREMGEDYYCNGFVEHWNRHVEQCQLDSRAIRAGNNGKNKKDK